MTVKGRVKLLSRVFFVAKSRHKVFGTDRREIKRHYICGTDRLLPLNLCPSGQFLSPFSDVDEKRGNY